MMTFFAPSLSSKRSSMSARRLDHAVPVARLRRRIDAVPEKADDERVIEIAVLESNQHFIAKLRHEKHAALFAGHRRRHRRPGAAVRLGQPGNCNSICPMALRVIEALDDADDDAIDLFHALPPLPLSSRRASNLVV